MKIIATKLTQKLANVLPEIAKEAALAFEESTKIGPGALFTLRITSAETLTVSKSGPASKYHHSCSSAYLGTISHNPHST